MQRRGAQTSAASLSITEELPGQARLADAPDPAHREQVGPAVLGARVEEILQQAELPVAPDERRLQADRSELAAAQGDDADRP
jgi:hypothetical protein